MRLCVLAAVLSIACMPAFAATTYVKAGRLLDVESGRMLTDQAIVIEDTRITAIGPVQSLYSLGWEQTFISVLTSE